MIRSALILLAVLIPKLAAQDSQEEFFGLDKIWDIHIEVERSDWEQMFPSGERSETRLFGKFGYGKGDVTIGKHHFESIGVRMKGNASFAANGGTLKKSLKLDFNRNEPDQTFLGMGKLNLQCNALDRTQIKEAVSYQIYRDCGLVAGRTCFARVFLTMPGHMKREYLGLYTIVEQVDQRFAKRSMGGGLILKPDGETLCYRGPEWNDAYDEAYHAKSSTLAELTAPLIRCAALFDEPSDAVFAKGIGAVMDIDSFLKYTAATAILINTDSPITVPDNYYLIVSKRSKKVTWVPWDMNWSMGEYGRITKTPTVDLSIMRPSLKEIFRRVLENPKFEPRYREIATGFIEGPASAKAMITAIHRAHATVKAALAEEARRSDLVTKAEESLGGQKTRHPLLQGRDDDNVAGLLSFAKARERSVLDQLAGKVEGTSARNVFGPNARIVRGAHVRALFGSEDLAAGLDEGGSSKSLDRAQLDVASGSCFTRLDRDSSSDLDVGELTAALRDRFKRESGERRRRDPSARNGAIALAQLDANADGLVSSVEWAAGIDALVRYWDRDLDARWSLVELNIK